MDKIQGQWTAGCSNETISFVKRSTIREGTFVVGEKVKVTWWRSKKAYNAKVLSVDSIPPGSTQKGCGRATDVLADFHGNLHGKTAENFEPT